MTERNYCIGLNVEGIGSDTNKPAGIVWAYGRQTPPAQTLFPDNEYEWRMGALTRIPESVSTEVNPLTGQLSISAFDFELNATDDVASAFLFQPTDPQYAIGTVSSNDVQVLDLLGVGVGTLSGVIWAGDEAILLGTHTTDGVYTGCTRGLFSTEVDDTISGKNAYTANPYHRYRRATLVVYYADTNTGSLNPFILWEGFVDSLRTSADYTRIIISCEELAGVVQSGKINRGSRNISRYDKLGRVQINKASNNPQPGEPAVITGQIYTDRHRTLKPIRVDGVSDNVPRGWLQCGDGLFNLIWTDLGAFNAARAEPARWDSIQSSDYDEPEIPDQIYQVFVVDSSLPVEYSDTRYCPQPYHPLAIALALLLSDYSFAENGYNCLGGDWGLGVPASMIDLNSWEAEINATSELRVDRLLLGFDGDEVDVWDVVTRTLLQPYGYYVGRTQGGQLNVSKIGLIDIGQYAEAPVYDALPTLLQWDAARTNGITQVSIKVGETPFSKPDVVNVYGNTGQRNDSLRRGVFGERQAVEIDGQTIATIEAAERIAIPRLKYGFYAMPRLTIRIEREELLGFPVRYSIGEVIRFNVDTRESVLIGNDGNRATSTQTEQFSGVIVGTQLNIESMTYTVTLLLTNYRQGKLVLWRAPATQTTGLATVGVGTTWPVDDATFGNASQRFAVGDQLTAWTTAGVLIGSIGTVTAVTADTITTDASVTPTDYAVGTIVRLESYSNYSNPAIISGVENPYTYAADDNGLIPPDNDPAAIYG
jgi:hypothetical protein